MKIDFRSFRPGAPNREFQPQDLEAPTHFGREQTLSDEQRRRIWRPIIIGSAIIAIFVFGFLIYAAISQVSGAVVSSGVVRVEGNRQTIKHRDGGVIQEIIVTEGARVSSGQPLIIFDDLQARAQVDVLQNQEDSIQAQYARYHAEATRAANIAFPKDLLARQADPRVVGLIQTQQNLFASRRLYLDGQSAVLHQRMEQLDTRIQGLQTQIQSIDEQIALTEEELSGYETLHEKGYAPKNLLLRYERSLADLRGRRGSLVSDVARTQEQKGETRLQLTSLLQQYQTEASEGLRAAQAQLSDVSPRLSAAKEMLDRTVVRSPVDGYVLNLTQFTVGGVAAPGETLMDIVPANEQLVVSARVKPEDIDQVEPGMTATVRLSAYSSRKVRAVDGHVLTVGADRLVDDRTGDAYFPVTLSVDPSELAKLGAGVELSPGMPVQVMIKTGDRSILSFLLDPIEETVTHALREP